MKKNLKGKMKMHKGKDYDISYEEACSLISGYFKKFEHGQKKEWLEINAPKINSSVLSNILHYHENLPKHVAVVRKLLNSIGIQVKDVKKITFYTVEKQ